MSRSRNPARKRRPSLVTYVDGAEGRVTLSADGGGWLLQVATPAVDGELSARADGWDRLDRLGQACAEIAVNSHLRRVAPPLNDDGDLR